jgi:ankyrin repeat protein
VETVNAVLAANTEKEATDNRGWTSLHIASKKGHVETVNALVGAGLNMEARNDDNCTPLHLASFKGRVGTVNALIEAGADTYARTRPIDGDTALDLAEKWLHSEVATRIRKEHAWHRRSWLVMMYSTAKKARLGKLESAKKQKA